MKIRKLLYTPLIATLILSLVMVGMVSAQPSPYKPDRIYVDPTEKKYFTEANLTGTTFDLTLKIQNVTDMKGFEWKLWYNATLLKASLNVTDILVSYAFVAPTDPGTGNWIPVNETMGYIFGGVTLPVGINGNYSLLTMHFEIIKAPPRDYVATAENRTVSCPLTLNETELVDSLGQVMQTYPEESSYYEYKRPQIVIGDPVAKFTWTPTYPYECDDVTLTSTSTPNGGNITAYLWEIEGPATLTGANDTKITEMHCDGVGTVNVTLTVWDSEGANGTVTHSIEQKEKVGCIIDVYSESEREYPPGTTTSALGKGANEPCDAYAPDEEVTLYAEVTFSGEPRNLVLVSFEVIAPVLGSIDYLSDTTNSSGVATVTFRIPGATGNDWLFGKWYVNATCSVADVLQNDTIKFDVGWILEITDLWTTYDGSNTTTFYLGDTKMDFGLALKNIALIPKSVKIAVVVKDVNNVPIAKYIVTLASVPAGAYCNPQVTYVIMQFATVPDWTYVGAATVYANAFTDWPQNGGIAYCPQVSTDIMINSAPRP